MERIIPLNTLFLTRNNNIPQINQTSLLKLKNVLIFNLIIIILFSFSLFYYYFKINTSLSQKKIQIRKYVNSDLYSFIDYSHDKSISNKTFNKLKPPLFFDSQDFYQITRQKYLYQMQKQTILKNLIYYKFTGTWELYNDNNNNSKNKNSSFFIGDSNKGDVIIEFDKAFEMKSREEALALIMKNKEGKYIDHWLKITSYSIYSSLTKIINLLDNTFQINGKYISDYEKGEIFETIYKRENRCHTFINMTFPLNFENINATTLTGESVFFGKIAVINNKNFTLKINSNCGFAFKVEAKIYDEKEENKINFNKLKVYLYLSIFSTILYCFGVIILFCGIRKSEMSISALNIECFVMNSIWNFYCFSSNIFLGFYGYITFLLYFIIIGLLFLSKFLIFDILIFYTFWGIKERSTTNSCKLCLLRLRFYIILTLLFVSTFFCITSFLVNYFYISIICITLWVPQIIHNIITNNRYGLPFIYILGCTIERIIYPFYFRGIKDNFFMLKVNNNIFKIIIMFVLFLIVILLIQTFRGPRFMLSEKYQGSTYNFYKNKEELQNDNKDINNEECVICLMPIFDDKKSNNIIEMDEFNSSTDLGQEEEEDENNNINKEINNLGNSLENSSIKLNIKENKLEDNLEKNDVNNNDNNNLLIYENKDKEKIIETKENNNEKDNKEEVFNTIKSKNKMKCKNLIKKNLLNVLYFFYLFFNKNFLYFYKSSPNIHNKLYILTPCKHIFHSECLELWLDQKKECPNCRKSFENLF